jgi:hypothetical protein
MEPIIDAVPMFSLEPIINGMPLVVVVLIIDAEPITGTTINATRAPSSARRSTRRCPCTAQLR